MKTKIKTTFLIGLLFILMIPSGVFAYASGNRINTPLSVFDNLQPVSGDPKTVTPSGFPLSVSETSRQGFDRTFAKTHRESTPQKPGMLLGFELRFLNFIVRSGIIYTDPFGLKVQDLLDELYPIDKRLYCELQSLWDAKDYEGVYQKSKQIGNEVNRGLENLIYDDFDLIKGVAPSWAYPNFLQTPKFRDHGKDFGIPNTATYDPIVYARLAEKFLAASKTGIYEVAINSKGEKRVYDRATRTLGAYRKDERTVTFYKVDASDPGLWDRKKWEWGYEGFEPNTIGQP